MKLCGTTTCPECPWLRSTPPGQFSPERFAALSNTVGEGDDFRPIFACHKSPDDKPVACVGYLLVYGYTNLNVRVLLAQGDTDPRTLRATGPLYETYQEMAKANGCEL